MKLYILRHGDAEPVASSDAKRQLTDFGREQVSAMAQFFKGKQVTLGKMICSPYTRAQQTAALFREGAGISCDMSLEPGITPNVTLQQAIDTIDSNLKTDLLMVSHQPLVSSLITLLVWGETNPRVGMDTSSLACLELDVVAPGVAELDWVEHASSLI